MVKREGPLAPYKGVTSPLYSLAFINAIVFGVHGNTLRWMENPDSLASHFIAGSTAGLAQCWICSPMELVKTRMQMQGLDQKPGTKGRYSGPVDCFRKIYQVEGIRGLSRGLNLTVIREIPAFGFYFLSYEMICRALTPENSESCSWPSLLLAGGVAGCVSWISTYPVDVIKSRYQADAIYKDGLYHYQYKGYRDCIKKSLDSEGWKVLFRGLNSTLIRAFPTNAATFAVVTLCLRLLRPDESEKEKRDVLERAGMIAQLEG